MNPESGLPFTEASAWNLLVQLLEEGHPVLETLGANCVIGRSFHYSYEPGLHGTPRGRRDE